MEKSQFKVIRNDTSIFDQLIHYLRLNQSTALKGAKKLFKSPEYKIYALLFHESFFFSWKFHLAFFSLPFWLFHLYTAAAKQHLCECSQLGVADQSSKLEKWTKINVINIRNLFNVNYERSSMRRYENQRKQNRTIALKRKKAKWNEFHIVRSLHALGIKLSKNKMH